MNAACLALADQNLPKGRDIAQRFCVLRAYECAEPMLDEDRPDLLDVITPPQKLLRS